MPPSLNPPPQRSPPRSSARRPRTPPPPPPAGPPRARTCSSGCGRTSRWPCRPSRTPPTRRATARARPSSSPRRRGSGREAVRAAARPRGARVRPGAAWLAPALPCPVAATKVTSPWRFLVVARGRKRTDRAVTVVCARARACNSAGRGGGYTGRGALASQGGGRAGARALAKIVWGAHQSSRGAPAAMRARAPAPTRWRVGSGRARARAGRGGPHGAPHARRRRAARGVLMGEGLVASGGAARTARGGRGVGACGWGGIRCRQLSRRGAVRPRGAVGRARTVRDVQGPGSVPGPGRGRAPCFFGRGRARMRALAKAGRGQGESNAGCGVGTGAARTGGARRPAGPTGAGRTPVPARRGWYTWGGPALPTAARRTHSVFKAGRRTAWRAGAAGPAAGRP
jgi:hypothetical protein